MSSGAIIVQNIILILFHNAFHLFLCKVLGCTEIHAHRRVVDRQIQIMLKRDLRDAQLSASRDPNWVGSAMRGLAMAGVLFVNVNERRIKKRTDIPTKSNMLRMVSLYLY
jgi:hypothetical protein